MVSMDIDLGSWVPSSALFNVVAARFLRISLLLRHKATFLTHVSCMSGMMAHFPGGASAVDRVCADADVEFDWTFELRLTKFVFLLAELPPVRPPT